MSGIPKISRRNLLIGSAGLAGLAAISACGGGGGSAPAGGAAPAGGVLPATPLAELEELSRQEDGSLIWYAGGAPNAEPAIKAGFERKYPWITLDITALTTGSRPQKLLLEHATNAPTADIATLNTSSYSLMVENEIVQPVELVADSTLLPTLVDPTHVMHPWYQLFISPIYNTSLVQQGPADPHELADPFWKGKIAFDAVQNEGQSFIWLTAWQTQWPAEEWTAFLEGVKNNDVFLTGSGGDTYAAVLRGERALGLGSSNDIGPQAPGTPMAAAYSFSPVPLVLQMHLLRRARRPASAQLFLNYVVSEEPQTVLGNTWRSPVLPGLDTPSSPEKLFGDSGVAPVPFTDTIPILRDTRASAAVLDSYWPR